MMNFRLIGAAALSLMLATPAMAAGYVGVHRGRSRTRQGWATARVTGPIIQVTEACMGTVTILGTSTTTTRSTPYTPRYTSPLDSG